MSARLCHRRNVDHQALVDSLYHKPRNFLPRVATTAGKLLGLSGSYYDSGEHDIFVSTAQFWPEPFRSRFAEGDESGAAVAYLDWIIANKRIFPKGDDRDEF